MAAFAAALLTLCGLRGVRDDRGSTVAYTDEGSDDADTRRGRPSDLDSVGDLSEDRV
jgi:hypothetical protein